MAIRTCTVDGCEDRYYGRGLCSKHYQRATRDPEQQRQRMKEHGRANAATIRERKRLWRIANIETIKAREKLYKQANRERAKVRARLFRDANADLVSQRARRYRQANPEANREYMRRRRARLAGVEHETYTKVEILERDGWECQIDECRCPAGRAIDRSAHHYDRWFGTMDHIVPISRGGADAPHNLQAAHKACNSAKGSSSPSQFGVPTGSGNGIATTDVDG